MEPWPAALGLQLSVILGVTACGAGAVRPFQQDSSPHDGSVDVFDSRDLGPVADGFADTLTTPEGSAFIRIGNGGPDSPGPSVPFRLALGASNFPVQGGDLGLGISVLPGGDLLVVGDTGKGGISGGDGAIVRLAPNGYVRWITAVSSPWMPPTTDNFQNSERFFGVVGSAFGETTAIARSSGAGLVRAMVVTLNSRGELKWAKHYEDVGGRGMDCRSIATMKDGTVCLGCESIGQDGGSSPAAVKLDRDGGVIWSRRLILPGSGYVTSTISPDGENCLLLGNTSAYDSGGTPDGLFVLFGPDGALKRTVAIGRQPGSWETIAGATALEGGTLLVSFDASRNGSRSIDPLLARFDSDMNVVWANRYIHNGSLPEEMNTPYSLAVFGTKIVTCSGGAVVLLGQDGRIETAVHRDGVEMGFSCHGMAVTPAGLIATVTTSRRYLGDLAEPGLAPAASRFEILQFDANLQGICGLSSPSIDVTSDAIIVNALDVQATDAQASQVNLPVLFNPLVWLANYNCQDVLSTAAF